MLSALLLLSLLAIVNMVLVGNVVLMESVIYAICKHIIVIRGGSD